MKIYPIAFTALVALTACGSDSADGNYNRVASEELIDEQVDSDVKTSVDSVARATNDGKIVFPLPDTLTTLLQQKKPQARVAPLTDQAMSSERLQVDNPLFLRGDFDGNNTPDYAVQVLQNDSIHITAFLDYTGQTREVQVAAYPARQLNNRLYSVYQLKKAPQDSLVQDPRNQRQVALPKDGISVIGEERTTMYVMQDGRFVPFDAKR